jgi:hypothetical protein
MSVLTRLAAFHELDGRLATIAWASICSLEREEDALLAPAPVEVRRHGGATAQY